MASPAAQTAKQVRKALKAQYPAVKFSVRAKAQYCTLEIEWTDGPTERDAEQFCKQFETIYCDHFSTRRFRSESFVMKVAQMVHELTEYPIPQIQAGDFSGFVRDYTRPEREFEPYRKALFTFAS